MVHSVPSIMNMVKLAAVMWFTPRRRTECLGVKRSDVCSLLSIGLGKQACAPKSICYGVHVCVGAESLRAGGEELAAGQCGV